MATKLAPTMTQPLAPSKKPTRYGPARYGTKPYGYVPPAKGRPGTMSF